MASRQSALIATSETRGDTDGGSPVATTALLPATILVLVALFLLAPWPFEHKAHAALHGLCAQIPSHTFRFEGRALPFDARMTGIYGGFLTTALALVAAGRLRAFRLPPFRVMVALGFGVAALAVDGTNSLLLDLGMPHAYPPDNRLRLATGLLTGIALAAVLAFVAATTLWRDGRWDQAPIGGQRELALVVAAQVPFALLVVTGFGPLYVPMTLFLLVAALAAVGTMALIVVVLVRHGDRAFDRPDQLQAPTAVALLLAVAVMAAFSVGRFMLERSEGPPPLT
ncbi:MAG: DUF2085 domain-containing protein [Chloroflexota bacterium]|nr:DUF2085 domain-containing protein [Chloroflexota bacterium]